MAGSSGGFVSFGGVIVPGAGRFKVGENNLKLDIYVQLSFKHFAGNTACRSYKYYFELLSLGENLGEASSGLVR